MIVELWRGVRRQPKGKRWERILRKPDRKMAERIGKEQEEER